MGWFESFCFTLGWQLRKQEKKERNEQAKLRAFRADCFDHYEEAVVNLQKAIARLVDECGPIGLDETFHTDVKLAPLYAIGEVLSAQGKIFPQQEEELKTLILELDPKYNYAQFTETTIYRRGIFKEYWDVVGIQKDVCGTLWLTIFEMIYRTRNTDMFQTIVDNLHFIVIYFYNLGEPDTVRPSLICDRIKDYMNDHINNYQKTQYIHALMLLQMKLLGKKHLEIKEHYLVNEENVLIDNRLHYVFSVYQKSSDEFCGKYAVRKIKIRDGKLDYEKDGDLILEWNPATNAYDQFYRELI